MRAHLRTGVFDIRGIAGRGCGDNVDEDIHGLSGGHAPRIEPRLLTVITGRDALHIHPDAPFEGRGDVEWISDDSPMRPVLDHDAADRCSLCEGQALDVSWLPAGHHGSGGEEGPLPP